jgi:radical SAM-linked protein
MERVLFRFTKGEPLRFVGHLDLMRVLERAMRRSRFPVNFSQGFNPRPRMSFASALTLGATSDGELCQLDLAEDLDAEAVERAFTELRRQLPPGMAIMEVWSIPNEKKNPYIQVRAAAYELTFTGEGAADRVSEFFESGPGIPQALEWSLNDSSRGEGEARIDAVDLTLKLPAGERDGVRIRDVVRILEGACPGLRLTRLHRTRLWCETEPAVVDSESCGGKSDVASLAVCGE